MTESKPKMICGRENSFGNFNSELTALATPTYNTLEAFLKGLI